MISLVIAASCALLREGICKILESAKDVSVVAETKTHTEIVPLVEQTKPQVLLIDTALPELDIIRVLRSIQDKSLETNVLLMLHTLDEEAIINCLSLGVRGYLTDVSDSAQLIQAITAVSNSETWADAKIITKVITRLLPSGRTRSSLKPSFTGREEEIIKLVVQGSSNKQIAKKLFISEKTVKTHLGNIFSKLGVSNRLYLTINLLNESYSKLSPTTKVVGEPDNS